MATPKIVQKGTPVLHQVAEKVKESEFGTPALNKIIVDMKKALDGEDDGAAIAAPQIGVNKRIFIISERVFGKDNKRFGSKDTHFVFTNPTITKLSKKTEILDEGCLSVRGYYGHVKRHVRATVQAQDEHGEVFTRGAGGLLAQVFQHECDHLDGTLFVDKAEEVWEVEYKSKDEKEKIKNTD